MRKKLTNMEKLKNGGISMTGTEAALAARKYANAYKYI